MGNVRMRAEQINYGATNVKVALDNLDPMDLIALNNRMNRIDAWKATVKTEEKTGAEVTFTNALALAAVSLSAEIEAEQDLHGQSAPYVGGAGKNKLPMIASNIKSLNTDGTWSGNVYTRNGGTIEMLVDDAGNVIGFKVNGTFTDVSIFNLAYYTANTGDILNGCPSGGGESTYKIYARGGLTGDTGNGITVAATDVGVERIYAIAIFAGAVSNKAFYPMIRLSTESDATFAPYSNICPISGRDRVVVDDTGGNLIDETALIAASLDPSTGQPSPSSDVKITPMIAVESSSTYLFANQNGNTFRIFAYAADGTFVERTDTYTGDAVVTTGATWKFIRIQGANSAWISTDPVFSQRTSTTIQLGQTVYGAEINWNTGVATITWAMKTDDDFTIKNGDGSDGGLSWFDTDTTYGGGSFKSNMLPYKERYAAWDSTEDCISRGVRSGNIETIRIYSSCSTIEALKAKYAGLQIIYPLATPTTIQLTPEQLTMLKGYNRLSSDGGGDITVEAYTGAAWGGDE